MPEHHIHAGPEIPRYQIHSATPPTPPGAPIRDVATNNGAPLVTVEPDLLIERLLITNRDDCDAVINLWYDAGLIDKNSTAQDDLRNCYDSGRGSVLIARKAPNHPVIATVMVGHDGKSGWVHYLAVAPSLRGRGHGATMLDMAENILSHVGLEKCSVHAASERAAKFYRRQGYRLTSAPSRSSSAQDDRFYEKRLSS